VIATISRVLFLVFANKQSYVNTPNVKMLSAPHARWALNMQRVPDLKRNLRMSTTAPLPLRRVHAIAFFSGYFVMAFEILGARQMAPFFGSGVYVWGAVIAVFMLALSVGYLLGGWLADRGRTLNVLLTLFVSGIFLASISEFASEPILQFFSAKFEDHRASTLVSAVALFTPPLVLFGTISPYAIRLTTSHPDQAGRAIGRIFFVSTLGSALGTLVTAFYSVAHFDNTTQICAMAVIGVTLSLAAAIGPRSFRRVPTS
jgi:predicted membrane-bound spermidine synthase